MREGCFLPACASSFLSRLQIECVESVESKFAFECGASCLGKNFIKKEEALIAFLNKHYHTLKNNNLPLSEIYERLAEYKVVNGKVFSGISFFFKAWFLQLKRIKLLVKIIIISTIAFDDANIEI